MERKSLHSPVTRKVPGGPVLRPARHSSSRLLHSHFHRGACVRGCGRASCVPNTGKHALAGRARKRACAHRPRVLRRTMGAPKFTQVMKASLLRPDLMAELDRFRREITVMFTDIRGSTAYFEKHGDIMGVMMVHQCTEVLRNQIDRHPGSKFIKTIGDAVMATFEDPKVAVECAIAMQK